MQVSSGRCLRVYNTGTLVTTVAWNPNPNTPVILAAVEEHVLILDSGVARGEIAQNVQELLNLKRGKVRVKEGKTCRPRLKKNSKQWPAGGVLAFLDDDCLEFFSFFFRAPQARRVHSRSGRGRPGSTASTRTSSWAWRSRRP